MYDKIMKYSTIHITSRCECPSHKKVDYYGESTTCVTDSIQGHAVRIAGWNGQLPCFIYAPLEFYSPVLSQPDVSVAYCPRVLW